MMGWGTNRLKQNILRNKKLRDNIDMYLSFENRSVDRLHFIPEGFD